MKENAGRTQDLLDDAETVFVFAHAKTGWLYGCQRCGRNGGPFPTLQQAAKMALTQHGDECETEADKS